MKAKLLSAVTLGATLSSIAMAQNSSFEITVNENAPVKSQKEIFIDADIETVWKVLTQIENWSVWQSDIQQSVLHDTFGKEARFTWKSGGVKIRSKIHTLQPYLSLGWSGKTMGILAIHNWHISNQNGKVKVQVSESMEGLMARILKKSLHSTLKEGMQTWLVLLKKECETQMYSSRQQSNK